MKMEEIIEEIRLTLTGGVIELGLDDETLELIVNKSIREVNRYINETKLITIPYSRCIDMSGFDVKNIFDIYRTDAIGDPGDYNSKSNGGISDVDPMMANWYIYSNGYTMYNLQDWILNYEAFNVLNQIENTSTTPLKYDYDKDSQKLYINCNDVPNYISIRYTPIIHSPEEIKTEFWKDILLKLAIANTKVIVGRVRSRYKLSNELWSQDGDTLLEEGNNELNNINEILRANAKMTFPLD